MALPNLDQLLPAMRPLPTPGPPVAVAGPTGLSLRRNFSWTLAGNLIYAVCQWGWLVVIAKLGTPVMVGRFALGIAVTTPILMLTNLQLRSIQATDAKHIYRFSDYFGLRLFTTVVALLAILGSALVSGHPRQSALVILAVGLAKACESISDVLYGLLQQHERMDRIAVSMMLKGPLSLLALGGVVYLTGNLFWGALAMAATWAVVLFAYDLRSGTLILRAEASLFTEVRELLRPRWSLAILRRLIWLALPLGLVMMLVSLNGNLPRYTIVKYLGEGQLGIFAAMATLMAACGTVIYALGQSASPRLARLYANGERTAFKALLGKLLLLGAGLGAVGVVAALVAGRPLLTLLYKSEYAHHTDAFVWLMIAAGIGYLGTFLGYGMTAAHYFRVQLPLFIGVTALTGLSCLWLIPHYGLLGAALALVVSSVLTTLGSLGVMAHALTAPGRPAKEVADVG